MNMVATIRYIGLSLTFLLEVTTDGWYADQTKNIAFVKDVKAAFVNYFAQLMGIVTDKATWNQVFGTYTKDLQGWFIYYGDSDMNFNDWTVNGFTNSRQPWGKIVNNGTASICGSTGSVLYTPYNP
jgi:hypothetical protein